MPLGDTALEQGIACLLVDLDDGVHSLEVKEYAAFKWDGQSGQRESSAKGDNGDFFLVRQFHDFLNLFRGARRYNEVRPVGLCRSQVPGIDKKLFLPVGDVIFTHYIPKCLKKVVHELTSILPAVHLWRDDKGHSYIRA